MASDGAKLARAAQAGDDAKVKRLLKAKVDVNAAEFMDGVSGVMALHAACANGHVGAEAAATRVDRLALRLAQGARQAGGERVAVATGAFVVTCQRAAWRAHRERHRKLREAAPICS